MSTGDGSDAREDRDRGDHDRRGERIGVGGGDDSVVRIQLAARWAEAYGPQTDSLGAILKRFRAAYDYLDAVTHGVEPPDLQDDVAATRAATQPVAAPTYAAPTVATGSSYSPPPPAEPAPPVPPAPEPRPWS